MATNPATTPLATPSVVGFPSTIHSANTHPSAAAAAPIWVATKAEVASPLAASALPALKPNHPNHSKPAPASVSVRLCGGIGSPQKPRRGPVASTPAGAQGPGGKGPTLPPPKTPAPTPNNPPSAPP